jgi:large subunit ribosomal protein L16
MKGRATQGNRVSFGEYAIVAQEPAWINSRQIEAARIAMTRHIKRGGQVWIRIFPDKSYTKKPLETRMGKGKAPVEGWVAVVKPGRVLFEMAGPPEDVAKEAMRLAIFKLPIRCKFMSKQEVEESLAIPAASEAIEEGSNGAVESPSKGEDPVTSGAEAKASEPTGEETAAE